MTDTDDAKPKGDYVSTAPATSALSQGDESTGKSARALKKEARKKAQKAHPWRDNIEAVAISIVTIVLFKYFVLEAYKIPTGSMQPTLMGNAETGIYDRVIVDKLSYHYRDPERFEIAVFKYPLDSSKNFIKRIVGMPGERLFIQGGDLWIQAPGEEPKVLRRPRPIQDAQLRRIETRGAWDKTRRPSHWTLGADPDDGDTIVAKGAGQMSFPADSNSITDGYLDGYARSLKSAISAEGKGSGVNTVTDLRVATEVEVDAQVKSVAVVLREGDRRFTFRLAGPAGTDSNTTGIVATGSGLADDGATVTHALRLKAGQAVDLEVQNLNDLLELRVDGDLIASMEIPPAPHNGKGRNTEKSRVSVEVKAADGAIAEVQDLKIWRDIFYTFTQGQHSVTDWQIPEDSYVVLGDNTQDSSDGRDWRLRRYEPLDGKGPIIRGNARERSVKDPKTGRRVWHPESNPRKAPLEGGGMNVFLRDEFGELRVFDEQNMKMLHDAPLSFVPRELVRGRAVLVGWPVSIKYGIFRPKWVR